LHHFNIEEHTNNKDLMLNATSQNDAIKVRFRKSTQIIHELWKLTFINKKSLPLQHSFVAHAPLLLLCCICHHCNLLNPSIQNKIYQGTKTKSHPTIILNLYNSKSILTTNLTPNHSSLLPMGATLKGAKW
jgi:hypothetical protein